MQVFDSCLIIERMKMLEGVKGDKELAQNIGVQAGTLSKWKIRNSLPIDVVLEFAEKHNLTTDWLILGREMQINPASKMALMAFENLDDKHKLEAIAFMSGLKERSPAAVSASGANSRAVGRDDHSQNIYGNVNEVNGFNNK